MVDAMWEKPAALDAGDNVQLARPAALVDGVYEAILNRLISTSIAPDERIGVDQLARALNVSQTPIREALGRLEADGLVVKSHLRGFRASPQLRRADFDDLFTLRFLLEPEAAARAALRVTDRQLQELQVTVTDLTHHVRQGLISYQTVVSVDARFHECVARASGSSVLYDALRRAHTHVRLHRLAMSRPHLLNRMYDLHGTGASAVEHRAVLEALIARDARAAKAAMQEHIARAQESFAGLMHDEGELI